MDTTTKQSENMETQTHGNIVPKSLIISHSVHLLKVKYSVFMAGFHQKLKPLTRSDRLTDSWKCHMKGHSVIWCGQIRKTLKHGPCHQEVLDGYLDQELLLSSIRSMTSSLLQEHISLLWMDTSIGSRIETWLPYGQRQTTATDAEMAPHSWTWMKIWRHLSIYSSLIKALQLFPIRLLFHTFCEQHNETQQIYSKSYWINIDKQIYSTSANHILRQLLMWTLCKIVSFWCL